MTTLPAARIPIHSAALSVGTPEPATFVITVRGDMGPVTATRLLRLLDARLDLPARGGTRRVLLDLTGVGMVLPGGLVPLRHARHVCARRDIAFALVDGGDLASRATPRDRAELLRHRRHASVEEALSEPPPAATAG